MEIAHGVDLIAREGHDGGVDAGQVLGHRVFLVELLGPTGLEPRQLRDPLLVHTRNVVEYAGCEVDVHEQVDYRVHQLDA